MSTIHYFDGKKVGLPLNPRRTSVNQNPDRDGERVYQKLTTLPSGLYLESLYVEKPKEETFPEWFKGERLPVYRRYYDAVIEPKEGGGFASTAIFDEIKNASRRLHDEDSFEMAMFALEHIREMNIAVYVLIVDRNDAKISSFFSSLRDTTKFAVGLTELILNPTKLTQIETLSKTMSATAALKAILNNIECTDGKKALVLPYSTIKKLQTAKFDSIIPVFQQMVLNKYISLERLEITIDALRNMVKQGWATTSDIVAFFETNEKSLIEKQVNVYDFFEQIVKNVFLTTHDGPDKKTVKSLMNHYIDALSVLPAGKRYPTNNIEVFHSITVRNASLMAHRRPEEFEAVAEKLRKLHWENDEYCIRPMQTEDELFYVGERYNNCLPIYRDRIIDDNAIVVCVYKRTNDGLEQCPSAVFEITPHLVIVQAKTYNDEDVTDPEILKLISEWKESKRYLLSNNRNVYRDPEDN